jgi:hypothetical protein
MYQPDMKYHNRRTFLKVVTATGLSVSLAGNLHALAKVEKGKRVGIIGLDTSHSTAFTKV